MPVADYAASLKEPMRETAPMPRHLARNLCRLGRVRRLRRRLRPEPADTAVMTESTEAMMTESTEAMMTESTEAMVTDTTEAMMTDTTGG